MLPSIFLNSHQSLEYTICNMIGDMEANKTLSLIVTELFLRGWKLNVSLILIPKSSKYLKL